MAVATADDESADELVRNADVAMYLAKSHGKGRFEVFEPSMHAAAHDPAPAPHRPRGRHRQPATCGSTTSRSSTSRPARRSATRRSSAGCATVALVPPGEFIPIAEVERAHRPADGLGRRRGLPDGRRLGRPGRVVRWVSVNLSSSQLLRPDIVDRFGRSLEASGLSPERLVDRDHRIGAARDRRRRPAIERLSDLGVRVAIDDFGIGYSTLSYLARLPIDIVKIDRSFVIALQHAGPEEAIASAIIALARRLGLLTIGEGIETAAQLDQLAALGCDLGQGYYLGRPVPNEDLRRSPMPKGHRLHLPKLAGLGA